MYFSRSHLVTSLAILLLLVCNILVYGYPIPGNQNIEHCKDGTENLGKRDVNEMEKRTNTDDHCNEDGTKTPSLINIKKILKDKLNELEKKKKKKGEKKKGGKKGGKKKGEKRSVNEETNEIEKRENTDDHCNENGTEPPIKRDVNEMEKRENTDDHCNEDGTGTSSLANAKVNELAKKKKKKGEKKKKKGTNGKLVDANNQQKNKDEKKNGGDNNSGNKKLKNLKNKHVIKEKLKKTIAKLEIEELEIDVANCKSSKSSKPPM